VTQVTSAPNVIVVHPSLPAKTVRELIALAKAKPGKIDYASSGNGSTQHLTGALFTKMAGIEMTHIPYRGSGPATADLLSGQVTVGFPGIAGMLPQIKGWQTACARSYQRETLAGAAGYAHGGGGWHQRLRRDGVVRRSRTERHAARYRAETAYGIATHTQERGGTEIIAQRGAGSRLAGDARAIWRDAEDRGGEMGAHGQGIGRYRQLATPRSM
jgi:hypothetical protein